MAMTEFTLLAKTENDEYTYLVTVEEAAQGLVRLVVSREREDAAKAEAFQGIDLTAEECEALGKHLLAISDRLSKHVS